MDEQFVGRLAMLVADGPEGADFVRFCAVIGALRQEHANYDPLIRQVDEQIDGYGELAWNLLWSAAKSESIDDLERRLLSAVRVRNPSKDLNELRTSVSRLLDAVSAAPVRLYLRAYVSDAEFQNIFRAAGIFSDIRPVFESGTSDAVFGHLVVHQIRLTYDDLNGTSEFFIKMSDEDLEKLASSLAVAVRRSNVLRELLQKDGGVLNLEIKTND